MRLYLGKKDQILIKTEKMLVVVCDDGSGGIGIHRAERNQTFTAMIITDTEEGLQRVGKIERIFIKSRKKK